MDLVIGDTHCRTKFLNEYLILCNNILKIAHSVKPDTIVLLGDDLHNHATAHSSQLKSVCDFILRLKEIAPVIKIIGNHEMVSPLSYLQGDHHFHSLKCIDGVTIVDKPVVIEERLFCPYVPKGRFQEAIEGYTDYHTVYAHQEFRGVKVGRLKSTSDDVWEETAPLVVSGHIHDRQTVQPNLHYVGSPAQFTFADEEDKYVMTVSDGDINYIQVAGNVLYKTHEITVEENCEYDKKDRNRVIVTGTLPELKSFRTGKLYKKLQKDGVIFVPKVVQDNLRTDKQERKTFNEIVTEMIGNEKELVDVWEAMK